MQKAVNFIDVSIVSIKGSDYRIHCWYTSKDDVTSIKKCNIITFFYYI